MAKFWIRQGSQYASVTQRFEYARIYLDRVLYILGSKYAKILNMQELHRIVNMPQYGWNVLIGREYAWLYLNSR